MRTMEYEALLVCGILAAMFTPNVIFIGKVLRALVDPEYAKKLG